MIIEKEIKSLFEGKTIIKIMIYDSAQECLESHLGYKFSEISEMGGYDGQGNEYRFSPEQALENMTERGCWGFCNDKDTFHIWVAADCAIDDLIHLLAHERGHTLRPFYRQEEKEEIKAERYGETARFAYQIATQIKSKTVINKQNPIGPDDKE